MTTAVSPASPDDHEKALQASEVVAGMVLGSSFWCGELVKAHKDLGHLNEKLKPYAVANALESASEKISNGDLSGLEAMLLNQASALESIFTSLAMQATRTKGVKQSNEILTLALKAQSGSRATINTLIDLKFPRTGATFVKQQNNLSQGPQQVNNGVPVALPLASTAPVSITQEAPKAIGAPSALPIQGVVKPLLTTNSRVREKKR